MEAKLFIIIPVYNTVDYLRKSVESVICQTYKSIQILLIDDGSIDGSGELCDKLAKEYSSIIVIHQHNKGQSVARNVALDYIFKNGGGRDVFIAFLDSDDEYGERTMVEFYINLLISQPTLDFVQFHTMRYFAENNSKIHSKTYNRNFIGNKQIHAAFCEGIITSVVWNKVYRSRLFLKHRFPEGQVFEDTWFVADLLPKLDHIHVTDYGYYKYNIRQGSTMLSPYTLKKALDRVHTDLKVLQILNQYERNSKCYLREYMGAVDRILGFVDNINLALSKQEQLLIQKLAPSLRAILKYTIAFKRNRIIKTILTKFCGIAFVYKLYHLKNHK